MNKKDIRILYKQKRLGLSPQEHDRLSRAIAQLFSTHFNSKSIRVLHSYLPALAHNEVNSMLILSQLAQSRPQIQIQVPVVKDGIMYAVPYTSDVQLITNKYGLLEPVNIMPTEVVPDLVITPLLAFDARGYRVGYGGGYYDKYFAALPNNVIKVGLSFFPSVASIDDIDEFDIPLDFCITPEKVYDFELGYS